MDGTDSGLFSLPNPSPLFGPMPFVFEVWMRASGQWLHEARTASVRVEHTVYELYQAHVTMSPRPKRQKPA